LTDAAIANPIDLSLKGVFDTCKRVAERSVVGLVDNPVQRKLGAVRELTVEWEAKVQELIADKRLQRVKMIYTRYGRARRWPS
jgi:hypothetical protein